MVKKKLTDREIEQLYESGTFKLTQERNDFLLPQVIDFVKNKKWMNLRPEYQRRLVWDRSKKSLFIESLIMNIPIPPIFLYEWDYSRYEVMDGQQRLSSVIDFYENRYKLTGLEQWPDLNGRSYGDLPPILQKSLDRRRISATVLLVESTAFEKSPNELRKFVFERLNTGGQKLNAQELRNCVYSGEFNKLLIELAGNNLFNDLWEMPRYEDNIRGEQISKPLAENALFKRMIDCEIVLRFFAFRVKSSVKGSVKSILDNCMERYQNINDSERKEFKNLFLTRLEACHQIFEERCFKIPEKRGVYKLSQPLFDAVMIAVDRLYENKDELIKHKKRIQSELLKRFENKDTFDLIVGRPGTSTAIKERADFIERILESHLS
ncbi:MAG: DUF262 domain-containing protein [Cyclobacteriaceae bacterium]